MQQENKPVALRPSPRRPILPLTAVGENPDHRDIQESVDTGACVCLSLELFVGNIRVAG